MSIQRLKKQPTKLTFLKYPTNQSTTTPQAHMAAVAAKRQLQPRGAIPAWAESAGSADWKAFNKVLGARNNSALFWGCIRTTCVCQASTSKHSAVSEE